MLPDLCVSGRGRFAPGELDSECGRTAQETHGRPTPAVPFLTTVRIAHRQTSKRIVSTFFLILALFGFFTALLTILLALFEPALAYRMPNCPDIPTDSAEFAHLLAVISDAHLYNDGAFDVLTNGDQFYEAELEAIRSARNHISLEAYIFQKGEIADRFIQALTERAHAGVEIRLVLDAVGSFNTWRSTFRDLIAAGG